MTALAAAGLHVDGAAEHVDHGLVAVFPRSGGQARHIRSRAVQRARGLPSRGSLTRAPEGEGWQGEIEGIDLTLTFLREKRNDARRFTQNSQVGLGISTPRRRNS